MKRLQTRNRHMTNRTFTKVALNNTVSLTISTTTVKQGLRRDQFIRRNFRIRQQLLASRLRLRRGELTSNFPALRNGRLRVDKGAFSNRNGINFVNQHRRPLFLILYDNTHQHPRGQIGMHRVLRKHGRRQPTRLTST